MTLRATLVAGLALVALTLTGCGGAERAASDGPVLTGTTAELTEANFVEQVTQAQREARSAHLSMKVAADQETIEGEGEVAIDRDGEGSTMATTMRLPGVGDVEARLVAGVLYLNLGPLSDNKFAKVDLDDPQNPLGRAVGGFADQLDPEAAVQSLEGAITSFEKAGEPRELDGVDAQPYRVTVDPRKVAAAAAPDQDTTGVPEEVTVVFWVGEDNLPRRVESTVGGVDVRVDLSQWGEEVDVEAPSPDEITTRDPFSGTLPSETAPTP